MSDNNDLAHPSDRALSPSATEPKVSAHSGDGPLRVRVLTEMDRARAGILAVRDEMQKAGPACVDCRHFYEWDSDWSSGQKCRHPVFWEASYNPVTGDFKCAGAGKIDRSAESLCGPGGFMFEPWTPREIWARRAKRGAVILTLVSLVGACTYGVISIKPASAIEARRAATPESDAVHESAGPKGDAQTQSESSS